MSAQVQIRITRAFAGLDFSYGGGEIVAVAQETASQWVSIGYAEYTATKVEQATVEAPERAATRTKRTERKTR